MSGDGEQLTLRFPLDERYSLRNYLPGSNDELIERLQHLAFGRFALTWVWGETGKSHLLQAVCQHHAEQGRAVAYVPLRDLNRDIEGIRGLSGCVLTVLDDVDAWLDDPRLEAALMVLYQESLAAGGQVIFAAGDPPGAERFALPDLASRCRAADVLEIAPLPDRDNATVIRRLADARGLALSDATLDFWLTRSERRLKKLLDDLQRIDQTALAAQRRVTIPLLKEVLGL